MQTIEVLASGFELLQAKLLSPILRRGHLAELGQQVLFTLSHEQDLVLAQVAQ
jgi:hypothetical protein